MRDRVAYLIYLDLDPVPNEMHTKESAQSVLRNVICNTGLVDYHPTVSLAPESLQPQTNEVLSDYNMNVENLTFGFPHGTTEEGSI